MLRLVGRYHCYRLKSNMGHLIFKVKNTVGNYSVIFTCCNSTTTLLGWSFNSAEMGCSPVLCWDQTWKSWPSLSQKKHNRLVQVQAAGCWHPNGFYQNCFKTRVRNPLKNYVSKVIVLSTVTTSSFHRQSGSSLNLASPSEKNTLGPSVPSYVEWHLEATFKEKTHDAS